MIGQEPRRIEATVGHEISSADPKSALEPLDTIPAAFGDAMDIMAEFHSMWQLFPAMKNARSPATHDSCWHEDPIRLDKLDLLNRHAAASPAPGCASETQGGIGAFGDLPATGAAGVAMPDLSWCGGLTAARMVAAMAEAEKLPIAPHDCTGPVALAASTHLSLAAFDAVIQESVRVLCRTWYRDLATALPPVTYGRIAVPPGAGLDLHPDLDRALTTTRRVTRAAII